jgi:hypothetical protein
MSVGNQLSSTQVDGLISSYAVQLRNLMQNIQYLSANVNGQGNGQAVLEAAGYDNADASVALSAIAYLNTIAGVVNGTATQATDFDFNNELSQYWGGQ